MATHVSYPLQVEGELDPQLSRWMWLVKWLLAIPHFVILAFLWIAFFALSVVAFFGILFTGHYPRSIFEFNVGVLRWSWRVSYYSYGVLGTDRYPPFTLAEVPDYPTHLNIEYPEHLSRGLVLVKWWLLAIPHYIIIAIFMGGAYIAFSDTYYASSGLIEILAVIAAIILLFTGRYPHSLFDLILGLNRWVLRVAAYAGLMTDRYPPFRLDMGGSEPGNTLTVDAPPPPPPPSAPTAGGSAAPTAGSSATRWGAGSVVTVIIGALMALMAFGMLAGGGVLLWADQTQRNDAGLITTPDQDFTTSTSALVAEDIDIRGDGPDFFYPSRILGQAEITVDPVGSEEVFIGVARARQVDTYLQGVAYGEIHDIFSDRVTNHRGSEAATPPGEASFWAHSTSGTGPQTLRWDAEDGLWSVVVMNADGASGLDVSAEAGVEIPQLTWIALGLLIVGVAMGAIGIVLIIAANRTASRRGSAT